MTRRPAQQTDVLLEKLDNSRLEFVVIGGVAAIAHGATTPTQDLDIACSMTPDNMRKIMTALSGQHPVHATRPDLGEIQNTPESLAQFRMLLIQTDVGRLDVLGTVEPIGGIESLAAVSMELLPSRSFRVLGLEQLIAVKAHVGRPKDKLVEAELRALLRLRLSNPP